MENIIQNKNINKSLLKQKPHMMSQTNHSCVTESLVSNMSTSSECHHARLGQYAANLWKEKVMTDILIVVHKQEFKAHKAVLACYSPYFSNLFVKPGFSDVHYLQLPSVTAKAFGILLEYMYTGELNVTCQDLSDVYRSARKLGMKAAMKECIELLRVTTEDFQNTVYLYVTARQLKQWDCTNRAFKLLIMNFEKLVLTKQFLDLDIQQILELLSSNELGARSEVIVFLAALKWINHKYLEREEYIVSVFDLIRFPLMSEEEILACYHPPILPGIVEIPEVKQALLNATCYVLSKSLRQENLFPNLAAKHRNFLFEGEPIVLWDLNIYEHDKFELNRRNAAATKIQALIRGFLTRKHHRDSLDTARCAAVKIQSAFRGYMERKKLREKIGRSKQKEKVDLPLMPPMIKKENKPDKKVSSLEPFFKKYEKPTSPSVLYIMADCNSGMDEKGRNVIFKYDLKGRNWSFLTTCLVPRQDARMLATQEALYILGGCNPLDETPVPLKASNKFIFRDKKWTSLPPMNHARSLHATVIFNNMILVIGGKDDKNKILSSIEKYDAFKDSWEEFIPLPQPRMAMGTVICGNELWVAGGFTCVSEIISLTNSIFCFEPNCGNWYKRIKLPQRLAFPTLLCDKGQIFCIGGAFSFKKAPLESSEEIYRLDRKEGLEWKQEASMPLKCHNAVASISDGNIYIFGGFSTEKMGSISDAFYYDTKAQKWFSINEIPQTAAGSLVAMCEQS